jgi:hypothetical protein
MTTYTVRGHPELDAITEYDKRKLAGVIEKYKKWYERNVKEGDREQTGKDRWAFAIHKIKDIINENMVDKLSTLEETKRDMGKGFSYFPVSEMFLYIDTIREKYLSKTPHPTLLKMKPEKLMAILDDLEICTRHVIQNTSIRRLHVKSWVHSDALGGKGVIDASSGRGDALLAPVGEISSLLCQMKEM